MDNFDFLAQSCPKMDLELEIQKTNVEIKISIVKMPLRANFQGKRTTLTFSAQICPKMDFEVEISKI